MNKIRSHSLSGYQELWYSYGDCCVCVLEKGPHCLEQSRGAIVFIHGRYGNSAIWNPLIDILALQYRCFVVEIPGFGRSFSVREEGLSVVETASLVNSVINQLIGHSVTVVGHDVGGAVAQVCSIENASMIENMILVNPASFSREIGGLLKSSFLWGHRMHHRLSRSLRQSLQMSKERRQRLLEAWKNSDSRRSMLSAIRTIEASWPGYYERQHWRHEIQNIDLPVLLLWGARDPFNSVSFAEEEMHLLKQPSLFIHENAGHWPYLEDTEWTAVKIREFIFQNQPRSNISLAMINR